MQTACKDGSSHAEDADFRDLLEQFELSLRRVISTGSPTPIIEARPITVACQGSARSASEGDEGGGAAVSPASVPTPARLAG